MIGLFGFDHHNNRNPWDGAPHWAIELRYILSAILNNQESIMSTLDDLTAQLTAISTEVDTVKTDVDKLEAQLTALQSAGLPADAQAKVDAAVTLAQGIASRLGAIDTEVNPPAKPAA